MHSRRKVRSLSSHQRPIVGCVTFPNQTPEWQQVKAGLEAVVLIKDVKELMRKLDEIHHVSQGKENTDACLANVFKGLNVFLSKNDEIERGTFLDVVFPTIINRALEIEELSPAAGVPLLLRQKACQVVLSRRLVASIVACGILCIFPKLQPKMKDGFRSVNFTNFYQHLTNDAQQAKLRCILHYFERLSKNTTLPLGNMTFSRKVLETSESHSLDWWQETDIPLCPLIVHHTGIIEDSPSPSVHVDFANRKIGGGVLAAGKVQEEIRFCTSPELLASMLLFEAMDENEASWIEGFETFSAHEGYARSLKFAGDFKDKTRVNRQGDLCSKLCAIDALTGASRRQYQDKFILRELSKSLVGFLQKACNVRRQSTGLDEVAHYCESLSQEIITTAAHQAALVIAQGRGAVTSTETTLRHPSCERPSADRHVMRSDSSDTGSESHHSYSSGADIGERSWNMGMRRRSSNLSDVGSRRSSDLASRRSSSSTRYSSDLSSDLEELYETFQRQEARQRPAAIKEELTGGATASGIQDFVTSMVCNVVEESSSLAAQMMPGVQNFGGLQPSDVAKPRAFRPGGSQQQQQLQHQQQAQVGENTGFDITIDLDSSSDSSNQTDDQKAKENIVRFVSQLVEKAFNNGASGGAEGEEAMPEHLGLHHSWSGSESSGSPRLHHYLEANPRGSQHAPYPDPAAIGAYAAAQYPIDRGHRLSHPTIDASAWMPIHVEASHSQGGRSVLRQDSLSQRMPYLDTSPRGSHSHSDLSPRISQLDGSPRSEATAMWRQQEALLLSEFARMSTRRRSSADHPSLDISRTLILGEPSTSGLGGRGFMADSGRALIRADSGRGILHGESLTDDFKEAVANGAGAFHAVQAAAAAAAGTLPMRGEEDDNHLPMPYIPSLHDLPDIRNMPESRPSNSGLSAWDSRTNFHSKSDTSLHNFRHGTGNFYRQDAIDGENTSQTRHSGNNNTNLESAVGYSNPTRLTGTNSTLTIAGQIVQQSMDSAVRTANQQVLACGGPSAWRNLFTRRDSDQSNSSQARAHYSRSLSMTKPRRRKGSMDDSLSTFAQSLARHSSLGDLSSNISQQRRGSSGFKDSTLSNFAFELLDTSVGAPEYNLFDHRRHSLGVERSGTFRRGSGESRASSLSRHSSTDVLFPACSTPEETPPWIMNHGRRSSREVILELLSTTTHSDSSFSRKQPPSGTSHLDWFTQDLLMESFNDAFIELFGQDYLESMDYQRRQIRRHSRPPGKEKELFDFADSFVQNVLQEAIDILTSEQKRSKRQHRAPSEEEEVGSNYEDALDVPFVMIESFASSMAGSVINKAYKETLQRLEMGPLPIATGNWGCGAFRGNPQLKCLLQWAAASCAQSPSLHYYTFGSPDLTRLEEVIETVRARGWNIGHVLQYVVQYARQHRYHDQSLPSLFDSLLQ